MMSIIKRFEKAVEMMDRKIIKPTEAETLKLYGLMKQATLGDNDTSRPWSFQVQACAKWDAWEKEKGKGELQAKSEYIGLSFQISKRSLDPHRAK